MISSPVVPLQEAAASPTKRIGTAAMRRVRRPWRTVDSSLSQTCKQLHLNCNKQVAGTSLTTIEILCSQIKSQRSYSCESDELKPTTLPPLQSSGAGM